MSKPVSLCLLVCGTVSVHGAGLASLLSTTEELQASLPLVPGSGSGLVAVGWVTEFGDAVRHPQ